MNVGLFILVLTSASGYASPLHYRRMYYMSAFPIPTCAESKLVNKQHTIRLFETRHFYSKVPTVKLTLYRTSYKVSLLPQSNTNIDQMMEENVKKFCLDEVPLIQIRQQVLGSFFIRFD